MNNFISYKRIEKVLRVCEIQELFNEIIQNGSDIIYYNETPVKSKTNDIINIIIVTGKPRD